MIIIPSRPGAPKLNGRINKVVYNKAHDKQIGIIKRTDNGQEFVFEVPGNKFLPYDFVKYRIDRENKAVEVEKIRFKGYPNF